MKNKIYIYYFTKRMLFFKNKSLRFIEEFRSQIYDRKKEEIIMQELGCGINNLNTLSKNLLEKDLEGTEEGSIVICLGHIFKGLKKDYVVERLSKYNNIYTDIEKCELLNITVKFNSSRLLSPCAKTRDIICDYANRSNNKIRVDFIHIAKIKDYNDLYNAIVQLVP